MRESVKNAALCVLCGVLGLVAAAGLSDSGSGAGSDSVESPERPLSWAERVPILKRIAGSPDDDAVRASPRPERVAEAEALVGLAADNPAAAMRAAVALDEYWLRRDTLERIASVWASDDPADALSWLNLSRDLGATKQSLRALVLKDWARSDPVDALNYLSGSAGSELFFTDQSTAIRTAGAIADSEPYLMLTRADIQPPGFIRDQLRQAAIDVIVERDPEYAGRQIALAASDAERAEWELPLRLAEERRAATDRPD